MHFLSGATFYLELVLKKLRDSIDDDEASERMGNRRIVARQGWNSKSNPTTSGGGGPIWIYPSVAVW